VDVIAQSATISPDPLRKVSLNAQTATIRRLRRQRDGITGAEYSIPECQSIRVSECSEPEHRALAHNSRVSESRVSERNIPERQNAGQPSVRT
jgi:hypothetical protein